MIPPPTEPGYIVLQPLDLALAGLVVLANAALSLAWKLGLTSRLALAVVRACVQLLLVGLVLEWVFGLRNPWAVVAILAWMTAAAAWTAKGRISRSFPGMRRLLYASILASSMLVTFYGVLVVLRTEVWYEPQFIIPIAGMILGNTLTGITLSLDRLLAGFADQRPRIEALLAHGASPREAILDVRRDAARSGMIPILNAMLIAGAVSLPGMMTGQILGGVSPIEAVKYQVMILFLISGATAAGVVINVLVAPRMLFDSSARPLFERIEPRG